MNTVVKQFGLLIKEKRIEKDFSQAEIAKQLGISQVAYGRYELGLRDPGLDMAIKIASVLDINLSDFFNGKEA